MRGFLSLKIFSIALFCVIGSAAGAAALNEGLLIEGDLKEDGREVAGRVLVEAGRTDWTTIASTPAGKGGPGLRLEARASLVDSDVVEVETRVTGKKERLGKILVQLGARGVLAQAENADDVVTQAAGSGGAAGSGANAVPGATTIAVKVLRVRYSM